MNALCVGGPKDGTIMKLPDSLVREMQFPVPPDYSLFDYISDPNEMSKPTILKVDVYYNTLFRSNTQHDTFIFIWDKL